MLSDRTILLLYMLNLIDARGWNGRHDLGLSHSRLKQSHPCLDVRPTEMSIPQRQQGGGMPEQTLKGREVVGPHEIMRCECMPQVVKNEIRNHGIF